MAMLGLREQELVLERKLERLPPDTKDDELLTAIIICRPGLEKMPFEPEDGIGRAAFTCATAGAGMMPFIDGEFDGGND
jgi:hypothetical protein